MDRVLEISRELDGLLNRFARGEVSKEQLETKRSELYEAIKNKAAKSS